METESRTIEFEERNRVLVAVKKLCPRTAEITLKWQNEVAALRRVGGPDCISMLFDSDFGDLSIILRRETVRSLDSWITVHTRTCCLSVEESDVLWSQMADALAHVHAQDIIHDDVNPSNIMWDPETCKAVLIDFGAARYISPNCVVSFDPSGTPPYVPPEFLDKKKGVAGDVWALGATMLFVKRYIALPDGQWFLPNVFDQGQDRLELLEWFVEIQEVRRRVSGEDLLLIHALEVDLEKRISSSSLATKLRE
ncbi:hypothetical protein M409DRAFT_51219 [Zasmidium cellare ATCC 36951]|uniref:Protein kinase domain-containing protein n=1 Tax=Zasmidium cellare ATCC 36951 TaxID=1080233 RepID=A0A6A6CW97_ZASCE|nr:uncharacterized protein M409DRAFT_51219 [Zasmidium cellare ATCC 36951]KAF2170983.1 hypothetical protein M409DRAFT_51219 [Zasmidium cellare ATCC 36951]